MYGNIACIGPVIMAVWSKPLPLIASYLQNCPGSNLGRACEKVANDLGLGGGFRLVSSFSSTTGTDLSGPSRIMAEHVTISRNSKFHDIYMSLTLYLPAPFC